jgi:O-methyltransferase
MTTADLQTIKEKLVGMEGLDPATQAVRTVGGDWPPTAETMIGLKRLDNIEHCIRDVVSRGVPGDLIETGVWRGGACIFMRAVLKALGETGRTVWAADSFQGLPHPDPANYPADKGDSHWSYLQLAVSLEEVKRNFERYGLLDEQVRFLAGWFRDTLPDAPIEKLAVLRLDGDMYESTMVGLRSLYPKVSPGGYVIVDDYGALANCKRAVDDYCHEAGIHPEIRVIDWTGIFWEVPHAHV